MVSEIELWKDVPGYDGSYRVSNMGRVKSVEKARPTGEGYRFIRIYPERILRAAVVQRYFQVGLCLNGKLKCHKVHRLVASCFVPGYFDGAIVNHIDGNPLNNKADNLEWCDQRHNTDHAFRLGLRIGMKDGRNPNARKVIDTMTGRVYDTIRLAARDTGESVTYLSNFLNNYPSKMSVKAKERLRKFVFC